MVSSLHFFFHYTVASSNWQMYEKCLSLPPTGFPLGLNFVAILDAVHDLILMLRLGTGGIRVGPDFPPVQVLESLRLILPAFLHREAAASYRLELTKAHLLEMESRCAF